MNICIKQKNRQRIQNMKVRNQIPTLFSEKDFSTFHPENSVDADFVEFLKDIRNCDKNIIILGDAGLGKTHLLYSALKLLSTSQVDQNWWDSDRAVKFKSRELMNTVHTTWRKDLSTTEYENAVNRYEAALKMEWLFIDDVGKQYFTESARVEMHSILDERYENGRKHFITSNLHKDGLVALLGDAAADRLFFNSKIHIMQGTSARTKDLPIAF